MNYPLFHPHYIKSQLAIPRLHNVCDLRAEVHHHG
jgi:hypothetical protein